MSKDIHKEAFDDGTKLKLAIIQDYLREWLPVFIKKKEVFWKTINVFDFFSGPGTDIKGNNGTPYIILEEIALYFNEIITKRLNVNLYFNEYDKTKYKNLMSRLNPECEDIRPYTIEIENLDFKSSFEKQFPKMCGSDCVNLLLFDQTGIKHITENIFRRIINLKRTDILFFVSSSTVKRFSELPSIIKHINLSVDEIEKTPYHKIHRLVLDYYKSLIPQNMNYYLASFTLKKNAGIYGLIYGSGNVLGIEKFLKTCWSMDPERGEANFDIDSDNIIPGQPDLFTGEERKPKKVELFEKELKEKILNKELRTDKDVYLFSLTNGFTLSHARKIINSLIREKKIDKCKLILSNKICNPNTQLQEIKII